LFVELSNKQQQFVAGGYGGYGPPNNPHGYGGYPWPLWWLLPMPVQHWWDCLSTKDFSSTF